MANLCDTTYIVEASDLHEDIKGLYNILLEAQKTDRELKNCCPGHITILTLLEALDYNDLGATDTRGEIYFFDYDEERERLTFDVESDWDRIGAIEEAIINKYGNNITFLYASEELGCEIFETNDEAGYAFSKDYYFFSSDDDMDYLDGEEELVEYINDYYKDMICKTKEEALDYVKEHSGEDYGNPYVYARQIVCD